MTNDCLAFYGLAFYSWKWKSPIELFIVVASANKPEQPGYNLIIKVMQKLINANCNE